jgi:hypothetical protein
MHLATARLLRPKFNRMSKALQHANNGLACLWE